jgi:heme a synthase
MTQYKNFAVYSWAVLAYNLLVIMWGAFVRATGSGAGCGSHWPLCNGEVIPRSPTTETLIEFSHRITSGLALLAVVVLVVWAFRAFPKGHGVRFGAAWAMFFMVVEALIGAGLVLFEYVATNVSVARAYWMAGHLVNTFFLLAMLALTAWWASGSATPRLRGQGWFTWALAPASLGMLVLAASGGIAALGDTLVYNAGMRPEDSPVLARLVDLRIYHPVLAFVVGGLVLITVLIAVNQRPSLLVKRLAWLLGALYVVQLLLGAVNVALKAPVPIQLVHLLLSNLIWIVLILLSSEALVNLPAEDGRRSQAETVSTPLTS